VFVLTVFAHGVFGQLKFPQNMVFRYLLIWAIGVFGLSFWFWINETSGVEWLAGLALLAFLGELYVFLITFVISSVSVAILMKPENRKKDFPARNPKKMAEKRIATLVRLGWLHPGHVGWQLTVKGRIVFSVYRGFQRLFCHEGSGSPMIPREK
jgi:hypothetical protein